MLRQIVLKTLQEFVSLSPTHSGSKISINVTFNLAQKTVFAVLLLLLLVL
jgi:hypothetical protein